MIKNKLIAARTEKSLSQKEMADLLYMDQSQYSRRENGVTKIHENEWGKIAAVLGKNVEDIYEEETPMIINSDNLSNGCVNNSGNISFYNIPDFILQNQQEYINLLKQEIALLKAQLKQP